MPRITEFSGLKTIQGYTKKTGISEVNGSTSGIIVKGEGLKGLNIKVVKKNTTDPVWTGRLTESTTFPGSFDATLTCNWSSSQVTDSSSGLGAGLGDPLDVDVVVTVGSDLNNPTLTYPTALPVGIGV